MYQIIPANDIEEHQKPQAIHPDAGCGIIKSNSRNIRLTLTLQSRYSLKDPQRLINDLEKQEIILLKPEGINNHPLFDKAPETETTSGGAAPEPPPAETFIPEQKIKHLPPWQDYEAKEAAGIPHDPADIYEEPKSNPLPPAPKELRPYQEFEAEQRKVSPKKKNDIELAKSKGKSPEQITARERIARTFLIENDFSEAQIETALGSEDGTVIGGFDLEQPIKTVSFPPPKTMSQYVNSHGFPGNWFDPIGDQPATALGINDEGRMQKTFDTPEGRGLKGAAKPVVDTWTNPDNPVPTEGKGIQLFVNNDVKDKFIRLNKVGDKS